MKKFCPHCGTPITGKEKFCKNCGTALQNSGQRAKNPSQPVQNSVSKQPQSVQPSMQHRTTQWQRPYKTKKSNKKIIAICVAAAIILIAIGGAWFFTQKSNNEASVSTSKQTKTHKKAAKKPAKKKEYPNNLWMLMGYMNYARKNYEKGKNVHNTGDLVKAVGSDFSDGTLRVQPNSNKSFTVSNDYGSVDVAVNKNNVKVTNDGMTVATKTELKKTFGKYKKQIQQISKSIDSDDVASAPKKSATSKSSDNLSEAELAVAAYLSQLGNGTPNQMIDYVKKQINKSLSASAKDATGQDYISGLYSGTFKGRKYYTIAHNFSTSNYTIIYVDGDQYSTQSGGAGLGMDGGDNDKMTYSKKELIKYYGSHKKELDDLITGLENAKSHQKELSDEMSKQSSQTSDDNSADTNDDADNEDVDN